MTTLIERLNARAHDPQQATDDGQEVGTVAAPPASERQVTAAEVSLGFRLPLLLRQVYLAVGDGGFGPGSGLFSLAALAAQYAARRKEQTAPAWPPGLVPICDWGSGIASLLDCTRPEMPVIRLDPNMPQADVAVRVPTPLHFDRAKQVKDACWVEAPTFESWLEAWADGKRLFYAAYGAASDSVEDDEDTDEDDEDDTDDAIDVA